MNNKNAVIQDKNYYGKYWVYTHAFNCPNCMNLIDSGDMYCSSCGTKIIWALKDTEVNYNDSGDEGI